MTILRFRALWMALLAGGALLAVEGRARAQDDDNDSAGTPKAKQHKVETGDETSGMTAATTDAERADVKAATDVLTAYLDALKGKKWDKARAATHPLTLKSVASTKKRLGEERHSMAPWFWAKDSFYLTSYKIESVQPAVGGTVVARVTEDSFQMEEKGELTGEKAAYLLGRSGGKWYVVDKKSGAEGLTKDAIKFGYPHYFDKLEN